jgi:hypothetical protein
MTDPKQRAGGYYWVKNYRWVVAEWDTKHRQWYLTGQVSAFTDRDFVEIAGLITPHIIHKLNLTTD